jgi:amino-acid N-acetyltransferase
MTAPPATIEPATARDLPAVERLLDSQHLPLDGVREHVATMVVARSEGRVVGAAALECYSGGGLLRSVVVDRAWQGRRLGHQLTEAALDVARRRQLPAVYLLTTTADAFFPRFGFTAISRESVPVSVQASVEFQSACPASAVAMRKSLV